MTSTVTRIRTPETDPKHWTIGHWFKAHDSKIYFCDSHETPQGYWMTEVPQEGETHAPRRTNVSERAIGRTFHVISLIDGRAHCLYGWLTDLPAAVMQGLAKEA